MPLFLMLLMQGETKTCCRLCWLTKDILRARCSTVAQDRDNMLHELISQVSGEFLNSDGTFRATGKVMDEAGCLYFVMGEDAKIQAYAAVKSGSEQELTLLFQRCVSFQLFVEPHTGHWRPSCSQS